MAAPAACVPYRAAGTAAARRPPARPRRSARRRHGKRRIQRMDGMRASIGWVWITHGEDEVPIDEVRPAAARGAAAVRARRERRRRRAHLPRRLRLGRRIRVPLPLPPRARHCSIARPRPAQPSPAERGGFKRLDDDPRSADDNGGGHARTRRSGPPRLPAVKPYPTRPRRALASNSGRARARAHVPYARRAWRWP